MCSHTHISIWLKKEKKQGTSLAVQCLRLCLSWWLNGRIFLQCRRRRLDPWVGRIPWRRKWQPTPEFLPGEFHGQRSLAGYSPWSPKEMEMTECACTHIHTHTPPPHIMANTLPNTRSCQQNTSQKCLWWPKDYGDGWKVIFYDTQEAEPGPTDRSSNVMDFGSTN